ncbi:hypothetical protein K435DRAFT_616490, partial [Dendrothele bispora CBS 962.96]
LVNWFYDGSGSKNIEDLDSLVNNVLKADDFSVDELENFSIKSVHKKMDDYLGPSYVLSTEDGWVEGSVNLPLP